MTGRNISRGLQKILSGQVLLYFLVGAIAIAVLGNAAYQLLTNLAGTGMTAVVLIAAGAILVLLWAAWRVGRLVKLGRAVNPTANLSRPLERKGLILLVSKEEPCRQAVRWHERRLERCWLVCSAQTLPLALQLKGELEAKSVVAEVIAVENAFDLVKMKERVEKIYASLPAGLEETDVILDFTGMPALASVGAVLACLDERRSIQYVPAEYDERLGIVKALDPVEIFLTWETVRPLAVAKDGMKG